MIKVAVDSDHPRPSLLLQAAHCKKFNGLFALMVRVEWSANLQKNNGFD